MPKINLGKVVGEKGKPFTYEDFTQEQLDGLTPKILKGDVTTLDPDQNATVNIRKEGDNNYIDFGIPRGKNGAEIKSISSENVTMTDGENLENTAATLKNNIDELTTPTFTDTVSTYTTLNDANDAAETAGNAIKSKVNIFTTLSNMKQSFSAIIQGLKILATNVGAINGITSDINSESDSIAASSKMVHDLNSNLSDYVIVIKSNNIPISLDAYTANEFKLTFTVPDGYKAIGFINFGSNSVATYQQYWGLTQTGVTVWLRNFTAYATNGTGSANILCVKQIKH